MVDPCVIWCISDGKMGHINQMLGLVAALRDLMHLQVHVIDAPTRWQATRWFLKKEFPPGDSCPDPDLILCAGSSTHPAALAARRCRGGRLIVLMKPSLPMGWFDLCIVPEFNRVPAGPRVINVKGPLNIIKQSSKLDPNRGLMLIGGTSKHHEWSDELVLAQIREILDRQSQIQWSLLTSRRTPASMEVALRTLENNNHTLIPIDQAPKDAVPSQLSVASQVWVTRESVSMTYEALTAGAGVGLIHLPQRRRSRALNGIQKLIDERVVTTFDAWSHGQPLVPSNTFPNEGHRCAEELLDRMPRICRFLITDRGRNVDCPAA